MLSSLIIFSSFLLISTYSYNFLVFCPLFAHSHHKYLAKIADTLTEAGHNVTFLAPIISKKYEHVKYLEHTKDIIYIQPDEELAQLGEPASADFSQFWVEDFGVFSMFPAVGRFHKMFIKVHEIIGKNLNILDELKARRKFDAFIYEPLAFCAHPVHEYMEIKTVFPSFSMTYFTSTIKAIGEPAAPSFLPTTVSPYGDKMNFKERLLNALGDFAGTYIFQSPFLKSYVNPNRVMQISEIESRAPYVFVNSNPYLDFPRFTLEKTIPIGGISLNVTEMRAEKLTEEFHKVLSIRKKNVLISFGSIMLSREMPISYRESFLKVIKTFPDVTFIWKYESDNVEFARDLKNVHFSKWIPQTALLADSRLSAFITHAGLGSVNELSYMGKPAILIPIFADQLRNAKMLVRHNGSISLNKRELSNFELLKDAVKTILEDESYRKNAEILGKHLEEQPIPPHELLVKHAEFGAKFGELPALDPYSRKMSFFSFYMIDIIAFFTFFSLFLVFVLIFVLRLLFRLFFGHTVDKKSKLQ